ncbi:hypothetical protein [Actinocatenispora comari]|uniref:hypothetical protein n=1 Tax=Actinocatenispora comari TaxID=2807577 RepID=UPI001A92F37B|nr:hypothetical protein [Actinocatenispora comari]
MPTPPGSSGRSANGGAGRAYLSKRGRTRQAVLAGVLVLLLAGGGLAAWYGFQRATASDGGGGGGGPTSSPSASDGRPGFVPASWQVAVRSLDAQNGWHDNTGTSGSCHLDGGELTATRTRDDDSGTGMFSCGGAQTHYRNVALDATVQVDAGCAGIWLRTGDVHGYFVEVCSDSITLHRVKDTDPSDRTALHSWPLSTSASDGPIEVGVLAVNDSISVYVDRKQLGGPVTDDTDDKVTTGRLDLGVFAPDQSATAIFTDAEAWHPANSG